MLLTQELSQAETKLASGVIHSAVLEAEPDNYLHDLNKIPTSKSAITNTSATQVNNK